ncbi:helix-turn-helix domain-containing protein [Gaoshiqia sediminis]|uniref:Helix-turn-helix transcriptional regulator n=1 Tax=Gaoshiqia sediminis TaxID=2986998 RepID=A0AA42C4P7_9BACT|nr:helix-turn-helix transcriptional regulator [Gaoshiqia sediminis]MCW0481998.1 helix-turn-helix transcriptional regulator [Gaoshiqia sediminis]
MTRTILFLLFVFLTGGSHAYEIIGKLNISSDWQPRIYLASINSPENLFVASPEFIVNETFIEPDGNFRLSGQDMPDDPRFYRLYLVRNNLFAVEFMTDSVRNFVHLILNNQDSIYLENSDPYQVFGAVQITGAARNVRLNEFENAYYQKRKLIQEINTVAKRDFYSQSLNKYIREFVEGCDDPLVGLFAIYHIADKETDFLRNPGFYFSFQDRLAVSHPKHFYAHAYNNLITNLVGYRDLVCEIPKITKPWRTWIIWGEAAIIFFLLFLLFRKRRNRSSDKAVELKNLLTEKERLIWESLAAGKTNKEIAADLFIELSTVKTHINNLYKRLGVSSRKEAIALYNQQK